MILIVHSFISAECGFVGFVCQEWKASSYFFFAVSVLSSSFIWVRHQEVLSKSFSFYCPFDVMKCMKLVGFRITANQGFYLLGLNYASPTFASAMQNSVPAITFVMASVLRYTSTAFYPPMELAFVQVECLCEIPRRLGRRTKHPL